MTSLSKNIQRSNMCNFFGLTPYSLMLQAMEFDTPESEVSPEDYE